MLNSKANAKKALDCFFASYNIDEAHEYLWQLFKLSVAGNAGLLNKKERNNVVSFYENLQDLLMKLGKSHFNKIKDVKGGTSKDE
jgi:hypothetical protein